MGDSSVFQALQVAGDPRQLQCDFRKTENAGGGIAPAATRVMFDTAPGGVFKTNITGQGAGFQSKPTITISGDGSGATAEAMMMGTYGSINHLNIASAGTGMTNGTYALSFSGGGGTGAAGTAMVQGGQITYAWLTNGGSGFTSAPTITIPGAGGTGSSITATMGMILYEAQMTGAGVGYTHATATVSGGSPTTNATATCTLGTTGPGNIELVTLAGETNADDGVAWDSTLNFYRDGESVASYSMNLGEFFACRQAANGDHTAGTIEFAKKYNGIPFNNGTGIGYYRRIYIPWTTGMRITLTNNSYNSNTWYPYMQVEYRQGSPPPSRTHDGRRMKLRSTTYSAFVPVHQQFTVINVSGIRGELESITFYALNTLATNLTFLEGHVQLYADGNLKFEYGGTEDFFGNYFYGNPNPVQGDDWGMVVSGTFDSNKGVASGYRFFNTEECRFPFENSVQLVMQNGLPLNGVAQAAEPPGYVLYIVSVSYYTQSTN